MEEVPQEKAQYVLDKPLKDGLAIVRRVADGQVFLSYEFDIDKRPELGDLHTLYDRGAYASAAEVLNHENLIGLTGPIRTFPYQGWGSKNDAQHYILWDWCDAGTLDNILREPPFSPTLEGFLPESLVWHVANSMLKALMWLHEGWRVRYDPFKGFKREVYRMDEDWMPIFHRDIEPRNIYFQSPRGIETYGTCKLGNFGKCYISGRMRDEVALGVGVDINNRIPGGGVGMTTKEGDPPLEDVYKRWKEGYAVDDFRNQKKSHRPYSAIDELFALGAILYRMMTGRRLPGPDACEFCPCNHINNEQGCSHVCTPDVDLNKLFPTSSKYSEDLREVVRRLLAVPGGTVHAVEDYEWAWERYQYWKEDTPDGKIYRDELDNKIFCLDNEKRRKEAEWKSQEIGAGAA